jgi:hypothetical protein
MFTDWDQNERLKSGFKDRRQHERVLPRHRRSRR